MPIAGKDNRRHKRRSLYYYLQVLDQSSKAEIGRLVDIHVAGLLLISKTKYEQDIAFDLHIPIEEDAVSSTPRDLKLKATVCWSNQDINPDYYVTGMQFVDVTTEQEDIIEELIRTIGFKR